MTKGELLAEMNRTGEIHRNSHTKLWDDAFKLYVEATKDKVNVRCGSCYNRVKKWLQS